jgi:hypothetical protein
MTDEELKQLAQDIVDKKVFTSNHLPQDDPMLLGCVFIPLVMMNDEQQAEFIEKKPGMVYEYLDKAMPMGIDNFPCFMSMRYVTEDEYSKLRTFYEELKAAQAPTAAPAAPEQ